MSDRGALVGIQARVSPVDPDACVFRVSRSALLGDDVRFLPERADCPLVERLGAIEGVRAVALRDNIISLAKEGGADWSALVPAAAAIVRAYVLDDYGDAGRRSEAARVANVARDADEVLAAVQDLLDRRFNPSIASHRGEIRVKGYADGILSVEMLGGCQGCAASQVTLRQGLTVLLRAEVPEVGEILDVTDHGAGTNPYY